MSLRQGVPVGAERLVVDVLRTVGSTLRFWVGDESDFDEPELPGVQHVHVVAMGSVSSEADAAMLVAASNGPRALIWVEVDGETTGGVGNEWLAGEEGLAMFVDQVQEQFLDEEIWGGWPFCPEHGSHLDCELRDGIAAWMCPRGEVVARVGDLT
jgi:hypothetical protein